MNTPNTNLSLFVGLISSIAVCSASDWEAPAHFRIGSEIISPDPGPFTATIGEVPGRTMTAGHFEPMNFHTKIDVAEDHPNTLFLDPNDWELAYVHRDGVWDGAVAEVFRVIDGKTVPIRQTRVTEYRSRAWRLGVDGPTRNQLIAPEQTSWVMIFVDHAHGLDTPYYFAVSAVLADGSETAVSRSVRVVPTDYSTSRAPRGKTARKPRKLEIASADLPSPQGFSANLNDENQLEFSWQTINKLGNTDNATLETFLRVRAETIHKFLLDANAALLVLSATE